MAWTAEYTWTTGALVKIHGRLFSVFEHANGRLQVTLEDETGNLITMLATEAVKSLEQPSPDEMQWFSSSLGRSIRRKQKWNRVSAILDAWAAFLPARIVNEDLGDYIEDINRRLARGQRVLPWIRVAAAMFWTGVNAVGYVMRHVLGRETKGA